MNKTTLSSTSLTAAFDYMKFNIVPVPRNIIYFQFYCNKNILVNMKKIFV